MIARYTLPEMGALWTDDSKYSAWLEVELAAAKAMAKKKIIPPSAYTALKKKARFNVSRINKIEKEVNHDVIAFLTSVGEHIGKNAKYLHYGMTSSDVVDTALCLQMKRAAAIIDQKLELTLKSIKTLALKHKSTPCIGRTHGILAEPTTLGLKFSVWYTELSRSRRRFASATKAISVGKISGAVGNFANLDPAIEAEVCKTLGLRPAEVSTQVVQRDRHAEFITSLAILCSSLEKFATEIRNLQRLEIGEMSEGFSKGQKGSSAMPHKKNPITAERITGIARILRGYALSSMENIPLWHERDIAHSSVERVIIPDATILADYALHKFLGILNGLVINKKRMLDNIYYYGGIVFSQRLLLKLALPAGSREAAYRMVQRNAHQAMSANGSFKELALKDADIRSYLSTKEIASCFEISYYFRNIDKIFKRVFGK
jgi:adenylosuccinate lyase